MNYTQESHECGTQEINGEEISGEVTDSVLCLNGEDDEITLPEKNSWNQNAVMAAKNHAYMPGITEIMSHDIFILNFGVTHHKSRIKSRHVMSKVGVQNDIDKLKKYLESDLKDKTQMVDGLNITEATKELEDDKDKTLTSKCRNGLMDILACILYCPCILYHYCCSSKLFDNSANDRSVGLMEGIFVMEDFDLFWDPVDISTCETEKYLAIVSTVLKAWLMTHDDEKWAQIENELCEICKNNYVNRLTVWLNLFAENNIELCKLNDLILSMMQSSYNNSNFTVFHHIVNTNPQAVINQLDKHFTHGIYKGISPLHLAIINRSFSSAQAILQHAKDVYQLVHLRATSDVSMTKSFPLMELPLNLAVWMGDTQLVQLLVEYRAEMCATDRSGNNVFHVLAMLAQKEPNEALLMFDVLLQLIDTWLEKTKECAVLLDVSQKNSRLVAHHLLFKARNCAKRTPLKEAVKSGCAPLVYKILNMDKVYKFPLYKLGPKSQSLYDFSEIDPLVSNESSCPSILEMIVYETSDSMINILSLPQFQKIMHQKSMKQKPVLLLFIIFHVIFMSSFNYSCYQWLVPLMYDNGTISETDDRFVLQFVDYGIIVIAVVFISVFMVSCAAVVRINRRLGGDITTGLFILSALQMLTAGAFGLNLILYLALKGAGSMWEILALSSSILLGWVHCLSFTHTFRSTSFFAIMMSRLLVHDVLRFLSIIFIIVLGFGMSTAILLKADTEDTSPWNVMFNFLQLAVGISDFTILQESRFSWMSTLIYITFLIIANILLFNLLIASMSNRYAFISNNGDLLYYKVSLADYVLLEAIIPSVLKKRAKSIYEHRILRIKVTSNHFLESHVYLMNAVDGDVIDTSDRHSFS